MAPCAIGHDIDSRPQSDMCSPDSGRIMEYEVMKHKSKACLRYNNLQELECTFHEISFQTKEKEASDEKVMEKLCISRFF